MTPTPINAIQYLAPGSRIECVEGTLVKLFADRKQGTSAVGGEQRDWSFQNGLLRGTDGTEIKIKFDGFDLLGQENVGKPLRFTTSSDPKAKSISVDDYQGKKSLQIRPSAKWDWLGGELPPPPRQQQGPPPQQQAPRAQGPPPSSYQQGPPQQHQQQQRPPAPPPQSGPQPILGATVGMAVKLAGDFMIAEGILEGMLGTPDFNKRLFQISSDIIRISGLLQEGRLAKSATDRAKGSTPAPPPAQHVEPDYEHLPPPNAAQRAAAENRQNGYPENYSPDYSQSRGHYPDHHDDGPPRGGSSLPPAFGPLDDDEIPF